jgi:hypothetical protein
LRSYNDRVDDERRQDLYRFAARVAGTRADAIIERRRSGMCSAWARACCHRPELRVRILLRYCQGPDVHAVYAARAAALTPDAHPRALALLDGLIDTGRDRGSVEPLVASRCLFDGSSPRAKTKPWWQRGPVCAGTGRDRRDGNRAASSAIADHPWPPRDWGVA